MAKVSLKPGESQQALSRRFRKAVTSSGALGTLRKKRWFVSKNEQRRLEKKKAIRRAARKKFNPGKKGRKF